MSATGDPLGFERPGGDLPSISNAQPASQMPTLPTFDDDFKRLQSNLETLNTDLQNKLKKSGGSVSPNVMRAYDMMGEHVVQGFILDGAQRLADYAGITLDAVHLLMSQVPKMSDAQVAK